MNIWTHKKWQFRGVNNYVNENTNKTERKCAERLLFYTKTIFMI